MASMANKIYAVDRIENDTAVCECLESGNRLNIDVSVLPLGAKEGDVIVCDGDRFVIDKVRTEDRHKRLSNRLNRLFEKSN